jgi:CxxC motif-containing protein (DUF1111 family)
MRLIVVVVLAFLGFTLVVSAQQNAALPATALAARTQEAPTGFDGMPNGLVDQATHDQDKEEFDGVEGPPDGLGPLYNAQSCRECHQNPVSGGASQVTVLRVGHRGPDGRFQNPRIPLANGEVISGRSLVNDRATCPEVQARVPDTETIRTLRASISLLGDGFVEAVADETLKEIARNQCTQSRNRICGQAINVPVVEAPGETRVGRFGWKNQHASLLSFSADAYLNEMGITSDLLPDEVTSTCSHKDATSPNSPSENGQIDDVGRFARFMRATKAPARDAALAATPRAKRGGELFESVGCSICHVPTLTTAPTGTKINGGTFAVPAALGDKTFHPFSDFLLHDVGTGDGIVMIVEEHHGRRVRQRGLRNFSDREVDSTQFKMRTAPLWGVRLRTRLMHDGASLTVSDAILRHRGEAAEVTQRYQGLSAADRETLLYYLRSL